MIHVIPYNYIIILNHPFDNTTEFKNINIQKTSKIEKFRHILQDYKVIKESKTSYKKIFLKII